MTPAAQRAERDQVRPKPKVFGTARVYSSDRGWLWHVDVRSVHRFAVIQTFHNWDDAIRYALRDDSQGLYTSPIADAVIDFD